MSNEKMKIDDDELNCIQQAIVYHKGDKRQPVMESMYNRENIIKCIGQLEANYKYTQKGYEQRLSEWSTGTVFKEHNNKCFVLTSAHNIKKQINECLKCNKYMENSRNIVNCIHCNHNKLECKVIPATNILFRRREICYRTSVCVENETIHYEFGDNRKGYVCECVFIDTNFDIYPKPTGGYDYCVLAFTNDDHYDYYKYCRNIIMKNEMNGLRNKSIFGFNIYGYPMTEREK
eukprot:118768_1